MELIRALTNPTRIRIVDALAVSAATPRQLATSLGEKLSVVGYHIQVLRVTGCVRQVHPEQSGPAAARVYELEPGAKPTRYMAPARLAKPGFGHPPAAVVQSILERNMRNPGIDIFGDGKDQLSCASIVVDPEGWREISTAIAEAVNRISTAHEESARRLSDGDGETINATIALASFESSRRPAT